MKKLNSLVFKGDIAKQEQQSCELQMENQIRDLQEHSRIEEGIAIDQVYDLSEEIMKDCQLKKGKKAKFIKHIEKVSQISQHLESISDEHMIIALAGLFKNLGKLGEHEQTLLKAIELISKLEKYKPVVVRWYLQLAALKSSKKQHQECYEIAVKVFDICREYLNKIIEEERGEQLQLLFAEKIREILNEKTKDEIIWVVNERSLAEQMLEQIKKSSDPILYVPYYPTSEFHIADYMSLEQCPRGWQLESRQVLKEIVIYLSICCFTMATQKYYLKDYSQKYNHLKSLKIALCSFDINSNYVTFLLKILNQHFGKRLPSIEQEHSETAERFQMRRLMPKDTKEINMKFIQLAEE